MALVALGVAARVNTAVACGPTPCASVLDVQPADGASGVALNTEIRVRYFGTLQPTPIECATSTTKLRLTGEGGAPLELEAKLLEWPERSEGWLVIRPPERLLPGTRYTIELQLGDAGFACACDGAWDVFSSFTTGADADARAPELGKLVGFAYGKRETSRHSCGTTDWVPMTAKLDAVRDDFPGARYNVYADGVLTSPYRESVGDEELRLDCAHQSQHQLTLLKPGAVLEIRGVDAAGNETTTGSSRRVADECRSASDSGCAVPRVLPGKSQPWSFFVLAALVAGSRLRRRWPRRV